MKNLLPQLSLLLLLLLPVLGCAQETAITGWVEDAATHQPISVASVSTSSSGAGTLTDEQGRFNLAGANSSMRDSLIVMSFNYERYAALIVPDASRNLTIEMIRRSADRRSAEKIENKTTAFVCNLSSKPPANPSEIELRAGATGRQFAFFIANPKEKPIRKLRSISFYIGADGLPMSPFRIRIYRADGNYYSPKTDLLRERVYVTATKGPEWYTYDLRYHNITVPEEGVYIGLEFGTPTDELYKPLLENYVPLGPTVRPALKLRDSTIWNYEPENGWSICPKTKDFHRYNTMVRAEANPDE